MVGWTSVEIVGHFYVEPRVEISGFVVDEDFRNLGIGGQLMRGAEAWTEGHGHSILAPRTNITRKDAHRF